MKALYCLAYDLTLNYDSADAKILFDIYASGPGTQNTTSDGQTWEYSSTIEGTPGHVTLNHTGLVLSSLRKGGVQIVVPEPGTIILLGMAGLAGLVVCAWRNRKSGKRY